MNIDSHTLVLFLLLCTEAWLGKTQKVKSNSILELLAMVLVAIVKKGIERWNSQNLK
jgi:hypothetical protein